MTGPRSEAGKLCLLDFVHELTPRWTRPEHLAAVADLVERAASGEEVRACVSVPPQHGKTELLLHAIVWLMLRNPDWVLGYASYNATQARDKSRVARDYAKGAGLKLRRDADSTSGWLLEGRRGGLLARGVGEGLTGQGLQFLVVDDPHKDRADAESPAQRRAVVDWFRSTALTRLHPGAGCIVVHTRWHPEDLIGTLKGEGWEVVNLPAFDEAGSALWPAMRSGEFLERRRAEVGEYDWASLYMGQPRPRGGAVFHDAWYYDEPPAGGYKVAVGVDLAYSAKTSADYSVAVTLAEHAGSFYVLGMQRAQCEARQFAPVLGGTRAAHPGARMRWYCAGPEKGVADLLNTLVPSLRMEAQAVTADKFVRAQPVAAAWNAGKVLLPRGAAWVPALLSEVLGFTGQGDAHDDQVDALAAAFDALSRPAPRPFMEFV